jgi:AP2-associated kinase
MQSAPVVGAVFAPPVQQQTVLPEIVPMRRGRAPASTSQPANTAPKPSPSPMRVTEGDPFAALDAKNSTKADADELSSRFPTLDQFSLLHDRGTKFDFDTQGPGAASQPKDIGQRGAEKLAGEAFALPQGSPPKNVEPVRTKTVVPTTAQQLVKSPPPGTVLTKTASAPVKPVEMSRAQEIIAKNPELQAISSKSQPVSKYVSTGTMTSSVPSTEQPARDTYNAYRFPPADQHRSASVPRPHEGVPGSHIRSEETRSNANPLVPSYPSQPTHLRHPSSSRPSLEGGRPSIDLLDVGSIPRNSSSRPRPASTHLESNINFLREKELANKSIGLSGQPSPKFPEKASSPVVQPVDETNIESNVDFLRSMEDSDPKKKDKGFKHPKRSSLNALSGTKNILAGRFGDAFKRFEGNNNSTGADVPRTPSPLKDLERRDLTPIAGSEATDGRSDDGNVLEETDDMSPEMRRERERRRLSQEEKRVAAAQAEYRKKLADRDNAGSGNMALPKSIGGVSRAVSIQNRVQSLLSEDQKSATGVQRTAQGYGPYSDAATAASRVEKQLPEIPRKPIGSAMMKPRIDRPSVSSSSADVQLRQTRPLTSGGGGMESMLATNVGNSSPSRAIPGSKPVAPRKPIHLNSLPTGGRAGSPPKPSSNQLIPSSSSSGQRLIATDLPGQPLLDMSPTEKDEYIRDFSKRFPSLGAIEMVERDLAAEAYGRTGK